MEDFDIQIEDLTVDQRCQEIVNECEQFKASIIKKVDMLKMYQAEHRRKVEKELNNIKIEKQRLDKEKQLWTKEKERIQQIQPMGDIIKLSISGTPLEVRRSTLCHVPGSSLEALFSGRHALQTNEDGRVFIDRNFNQFNALIDYIRNGGQFFGSKKEQLQLLENELSFWGISKGDFIMKPKDKYELMQQSIDKPFFDFSVEQENFGLTSYMQKRMNFKEICQKGKLDFKKDFKIEQISEVYTLVQQPGREILHFGKVLVFENEPSEMKLTGLGIGQIKLRENGYFGLGKGYGESYGKDSYYHGEWKNGNCDGKGRLVNKYGIIFSGFFENDEFKRGKITYPDGTILDGEFQYNRGTNQFELINHS